MRDKQLNDLNMHLTTGRQRKGMFILHTLNLFLLAFFFFFISCNSGNSDNNPSATSNSLSVKGMPAYDRSLARGVVIDSVICRNQNSQNYALYLPSNYSADKKFPCIYFFDAHARGAMPLDAYKELAEKYGFVLVGSNISKNGTQWETTNDVVHTMMEDARSRINIDPKRIYTAGFSGGSRVAATVAVVDGDVAGVIGCAAAFPSVEQGIHNKFDYFGMVGDYDFNLTEMEKWDEALEQNGFSHQLLTSGGIHGWPSKADFGIALLWMQVNAMKEHIQSQNDTLIASLKNNYDKRIAAAKSSGEWIKAQELLAGIIRALDGLTDISSYKKQLASLVESSNYKNASALQDQLQQEEISGQQELSKQFTQQDETWWAKKIADLNQKARNAKTTQESQMYLRLLNYLGLVGYMNVNHALNVSDLANALTYLKIFKMADPANPDYSYLTSVYYLKNNDPAKAVSCLNEAAALGYSEVATLITNPAFNSLHDDPAFKRILNKVWENNKKIKS